MLSKIKFIGGQIKVETKKCKDCGKSIDIKSDYDTCDSCRNKDIENKRNLLVTTIFGIITVVGAYKFLKKKEVINFLVSTILEAKLAFLFNFYYNRNEVKIWIILLDLNILKKLNNL